MHKNLSRIEKWLEKNAPKIAADSLQKPANEASFKQLENIVGIEIPQSFKQLYLWHDGMSDSDNCGSLFYGMFFMPIENIIDEYQLYTQQEKSDLEKADDAIDKSNMNHSHWIRFCFDGAHTWLCLDLSPTDKGRAGQIIFLDEEYQMGILVANSTSDLVSDFANDLESGLYHLNSDALEEGQHFLDTNDEISLLNWYHSKKWAR